MQAQKTIFITGGTGYVGCHLAHALLQQGHRVVVLARSSKNRAAAARVHKVINQVDHQNPANLDNLVVVEGDVREAAADLRAKLRRQISQPFDEIWHCVATFKFRESERDEIRAINIDGVRHIMELVLDINGTAVRPRYFHVSTAYSSGREYEVVPEALTSNDGNFRSLYEWSKHEGERMVARYQRENNLDVIIFRPAIIVGSATTTIASYSAYYQVCEALYRLRNRVAQNNPDFDGEIKVRLLGNPDTHLNFVPIDYVTRAMLLTAQESELISGEIKVFNVVNEQPPTLRQIHRVFCYSLGVHGLKLVPAAELTNPNRLEKVLAKGIAFQAPYMSDDIRFETNNFRQIVPESILPKLKMDDHFLDVINRAFFAHLEHANGSGGK